MRIAVVHDFFRSDSLLPNLGQNADIAGRRFMSLIGPPLRALGHEVMRLTEVQPGRPSPLLALAQRHGWEPGAATWAHAFSDPGYARQIEPMLAGMANFDLVIGWEMTPNMLRYLLARRIKFLDVAIDPIRFGPDQFVRMRSNEKRLAERLAEQATPDAPLIEIAAGMRARLPPPATPRQPSVVIVCQTEIAANLVAGGELVRIQRFIPAIAASLQPHQDVLLKPHPHGAPHTDVQALHAALPRARVVDDNIYGLLASPWVERVVTLSSSVADESALFGMPVTRLIESDASPERTPPEVSRPFRIDARFTTQRFWADTLMRSRHLTLPSEPPARPLRELLANGRGHTDWPPAPVSRRVAPGDELSFGAAQRGAALCVIGWSTAEEWGVWSDGYLATLLIEPAEAADGMVLELHLTAFVPDPDRPMRFDLSVRPSGHVRTVSLASNDVPPLVIEIPADLCRGGAPVEIGFRFHGLVTPASLGMGSDDRSLGVGLRRMVARGL